MAADPWRFYNSFTELSMDGTFDMDDDSFKVALFLSTSNCETLTFDEYTDLTNEHSNANGYTTGGTAVTATWTRSGGETVFAITNPSWTASGGSIIARFAVLYETATNFLVAYQLLDNTPADVSAADGEDFVIQIDSRGVFSHTGEV